MTFRGKQILLTKASVAIRLFKCGPAICGKGVFLCVDEYSGLRAALRRHILAAKIKTVSSAHNLLYHHHPHNKESLLVMKSVHSQRRE